MFALVSVTRNEVIERVEFGHCVLADRDGQVLWSAGDADHRTFLRSSAKPFQATALALSGAMERFGLAPTNLAVACGSHHGEPGHVETALHTLTAAGIPPTALQCGIHDLGEPEGSRLARAGLSPTPLHNNCSGKHAGMLAAAQALNAPLDSYLDPGHPVQQLILRNMATVAGVDPAQVHVGIDGCSAPNFALPITAMARAFARLGRPDALDEPLAGALARVGEAMHAHPWLVSGTTGFDTALMQHAPVRVVSKAGAEGLQCVALPSLGLGLAVKISSGRADRLPSVVLAILRGLGLLQAELPRELAQFDAPPQRNHRGRIVGETIVHLDPQVLDGIAAEFGSATRS